MNSDERIYPVTIDPTVYYGGYRQGNMRDSIISQNYPNNNVAGLAAKAKAAVLSGWATAEFELFGKGLVFRIKPAQ